MSSRVGLVILVLICVGLAGGLVWTEKHAADQRAKDNDSITIFSNQVVQTSANLDQQRQVNTALEGDLKKQRHAYSDLTNSYTELAGNLERSQASLKSARDEVTQRDARITTLESQNRELDQHALDLSAAITNLTAQIEMTRQKLAASEGDKVFLEKELERLTAEKIELERQFNDLTALRVQVAKLKQELNISRRLEWIRQGLFARNDQRGAEQLMQMASVTNPRQAKEQPSYDLNVEVSADGTVRVVPAVTNQPTATTVPAAASP